jgi:hypothetical protein
MSRADLRAVNGGRSAALSSAVPALYHARHARNPDRIEAEKAMTMTPAGQPGHGTTASVRRQPVRILEGRVEGGYTDAFEIICYDCGDHRYLDYSQVPLRLQQIRGPYMMEAALAAYEQHLGLADRNKDPRTPLSEP